MSRRVMSTASRLALLAATGVAAMSIAAQGADLGGNCCADLEERVADLEATTVRKGNRKVSLQIYGAIAQQIMFWDDGGERNTYVLSDQMATQTLGFIGNARINPEWTAGYKLEFEVVYNQNGGANQLMNGEHGGTTTGAPLNLRHSALYLQNPTLGTFWLGHTSAATSVIMDINLAAPGGVNSIARSLTYNFGPAFRMRREGTTGSEGLSTLNNRVGFLSQTQLAGLGGISRRAGVKWQSAAFLGLSKSSGFNLQAFAGEDDMWDVALRYVEDFGTFRVAAGIGRASITDFEINCSNLTTAGAGGQPGNFVGAAATAISQSAVNCSNIGGSASIMHVPSGIYISGGYNELHDKNRDRLFGRNVKDVDKGWYMQGGIQQKFNALGLTTLYGEYFSADGGAATAAGARTGMRPDDPLNPLGGSTANANAIANTSSEIISTGGRAWGVGAVQRIDAAAMDIYLAYKHTQPELTLQRRDTLAISKSNDIAAWQAVIMGATIRF